MAPLEAVASSRKIESLSLLTNRRCAESPTPFESNKRSRMSSLSMTGRLSKAESRFANEDLPLPGRPETTINGLSVSRVETIH